MRTSSRKVERNKADIEILDGTKKHGLDKSVRIIGTSKLDKFRVG